MDITGAIGALPYRMALAGGWIDQPFISRLNPNPPGSMVVVSLRPSFRLMNRCGMATSTRQVAASLWGDHLPEGDPSALVRQLYQAENQGRAEPSGSQDMAGLIYPGINRLDYDCASDGGYFPVHVESCTDPRVATWLEDVTYLVAVNQRPDGYNPLETRNLDPQWIHRLGQTGRDCYDAIHSMDLRALGASMNACMDCWEFLLPGTVRHPTIRLDLVAILRYYQSRYPGAMYSGCGGGYLIVVADEAVPGGTKINVRI